MAIIPSTLKERIAQEERLCQNAYDLVYGKKASDAISAVTALSAVAVKNTGAGIED